MFPSTVLEREGGGGGGIGGPGLKIDGKKVKGGLKTASANMVAGNGEKFPAGYSRTFPRMREERKEGVYGR